jgi:hypothetical protein
MVSYGYIRQIVVFETNALFDEIVITGVYITINDSYREINMEIQGKFIKSKNIRINLLTFNKKKIVYLYKNAEFIRHK